MIPFEQEVTYVKNDKIRATLNSVLCHMPKWFMKEGASSTGKYHPKYAQGEGGLYRHTRAAAKIANDLLSLEMFGEMFNDTEKDWIICGLILHDMCKYGYKDEPERYTRHDHPIIVFEWLEQLQLDGVDIPQEFIDNVNHCVESHMGQWNTNKYHPNVVLPKPQSNMQKFVHMCDYLASRQYLEVEL